jgi:hypothetical protein
MAFPGETIYIYPAHCLPGRLPLLSQAENIHLIAMTGQSLHIPLEELQFEIAELYDAHSFHDSFDLN